MAMQYLPTKSEEQLLQEFEKELVRLLDVIVQD